MKKEEVAIKVLSGFGKIVQGANKTVKNIGETLIEDKIIKGKYVQREEYDQLKNIVIDIKEKIDKMSKND